MKVLERGWKWRVSLTQSALCALKNQLWVENRLFCSYLLICITSQCTVRVIFFFFKYNCQCSSAMNKKISLDISGFLFSRSSAFQYILWVGLSLRRIRWHHITWVKPLLTVSQHWLRNAKTFGILQRLGARYAIVKEGVFRLRTRLLL